MAYIVRVFDESANLPVAPSTNATPRTRREIRRQLREMSEIRRHRVPSTLPALRAGESSGSSRNRAVPDYQDQGNYGLVQAPHPRAGPSANNRGGGGGYYRY
ncbi:hypothetical protein V499_04863 [Pseudogymnoascus sp. VKM F-103]|nr:hypothetical protein V499_04863 [Pseudogymnoascus sp. VKM F-103]